MTLHQENAVCACGLDYAAHEERNGYCPLRLDEKFRPAPDLPVMALRPEHDNPDLMDDIVVEDVTCFRAEAMSESNFWVCCYLKNGERVTWHVTAHCRPRRIEWALGEVPDYIDWDKHPEARRGV